MEGKEGSSASPFMPMFETFRQELEEHHDRKERVIKASRDVTAASKKIIFTLQRTRHIQQPLPESTTKSNAPYLNTITTQLAAIAPDLQNLNTYRYARQVSGGLQEYVEAASFQHYLETGTLLGPDAATSALDPSITLGHEDYLLGIYDMTGELMRFAITSMATHQSVPTLTLEGSEHQRNILTDMRQLRAALESLECGSGPFAKDADKKGEVMRVSVEKVERALYGLTVRGAERPKGWMPAFEEVGRGLEVEA